MRRELASQTLIAAPPERVWSVLTDLPGWARWNPVMPSVRGELVTAERLEATLALPEARPRTLRPEVMRVLPARELSWLVRLGPPGLLDCEHRFVLQRPDPDDETGSADGTCLIQRTRISGILVPFLWPRLRRLVGEGLRQSNAALEAEVTGAGTPPST